MVLVGRRGPARLAVSAGELREVLALPGLRVVVEDRPGVRAVLTAPDGGPVAALLAGADVEPVDLAAPPPPGSRLVLRADSRVVEVLGPDRVRGLRLEREGGTDVVAAGLVVRATGSRGRPVPGLPFDDARGTVPSAAGRVLDPATGRPVPGTYVAGWVARSPSGGIGANRLDALAAVDSLLEDAAAGRLAPPTSSRRAFERLVRARRR